MITAPGEGEGEGQWGLEKHKARCKVVRAFRPVIQHVLPTPLEYCKERVETNANIASTRDYIYPRKTIYVAAKPSTVIDMVSTGHTGRMPLLVTEEMPLDTTRCSC